MKSMHGAKPDPVLDLLLSAVNQFARGAPQADDITVLVFRYQGTIVEGGLQTALRLAASRTRLTAAHRVFFPSATSVAAGNRPEGRALLPR